jgi:putative DNA primase/helicase
LDEVFLGDAEVIECMQRWAGYTLTGDRREQKLMFCYGVGANGKSTYWDTLAAAIGSYAMKLPAHVLMQSQLQSHPTELAQLHGVRLALSSELEEGHYWAEARIKELTGDGVLRARYMRQDFFEFPMTQKHTILGNFKPRLKGGDYALARRFLLVPFRAKFTGAARDDTLMDRLKAEAPAILAWAIQGAVKWHSEGLAVPSSISAASAEYMRDNDDLSLWMDERCCLTEPARTRAADLYKDYSAWLRARGQQAPSMKLWADRMAAQEGIRKVKSSGVMVYLGIGLMEGAP